MRLQTRKLVVATTGLDADPGANYILKVTRIEPYRSETLVPLSGGAESGFRVSQEACAPQEESHVCYTASYHAAPARARP